MQLLELTVIHDSASKHIASVVLASEENPDFYFGACLFNGSRKSYLKDLRLIVDKVNETARKHKGVANWDVRKADGQRLHFVVRCIDSFVIHHYLNGGTDE